MDPTDGCGDARPLLGKMQTQYNTDIVTRTKCARLQLRRHEAFHLQLLFLKLWLYSLCRRRATQNHPHAKQTVFIDLLCIFHAVTCALLLFKETSCHNLCPHCDSRLWKLPTWKKNLNLENKFKSKREIKCSLLGSFLSHVKLSFFFFQ